jgi:hypothetical protein
LQLPGKRKGIRLLQQMLHQSAEKPHQDSVNGASRGLGNAVERSTEISRKSFEADILTKKQAFCL